MLIKLINPKGLTASEERNMAPRPASLEGLTIGLLSNEKANARNLLNETAALFARHHDCRALPMECKHDVSRPAYPELLESIAERADFLITAAGD